MDKVEANSGKHEALAKKMEELSAEIKRLSSKPPNPNPVSVSSLPSLSFPLRESYDQSQASGVLYSKSLRSSPNMSLLSTFPDYGSLQDEFGKLLQAKSRTQLQVVMGPILTKDDGVDGRPKPDELEAVSDDEVAAILADVGISSSYVITIMNAEKRLVKVRFEGLTARDSRDTLLAAWKKLNEDHGVWISPDQPIDLSKMEWNAKKFGITLRKSFASIGNPYVTVQDGVLLIGATPVAPVYLIPEPAKWPLINQIVLEALSGGKDLPWAKRKLHAPSGSLASKIWDVAWASDQNSG